MSSLLIDNDRESQALVRTVFAGRGESLLQAADTEMGIRILTREQPDLILLGLGLSGALAFLERMRESFPDIPIILLADAAQPERLSQALQSGGRECLVQPLSPPAVFLHTLRMNLDHARLRRVHHDPRNRIEPSIHDTAQAIRKSEQRYRSIFENLQDVYIEASLDGTILEISPSVEHESRYTMKELLGTSVYALYSNDQDRERLVHRLMADGRVDDYELLLRDKDGAPLHCTTTAVLHRKADGTPERICGSIRNISSRKRVEQDLRERENHYSSLVANIPVGICRCSPGEDGGFIMANPAMATILGYAAVEELPPTRPDRLLAHESDQRQLLEILRLHGKAVSSELQLRKKDGTSLWTSLSAYMVKDDSGEGRYIDFLIEDISKRKEAEETIHHLASFDMLTDLPNRSMLLFHLNQAIYGARRRSAFGGVILMDLDRFKIVNDSLGHETGDILLKQVAARLKRLIRAEDTAARIGSDEFAALFTDISKNAQDSGQKLGRIAEKLRQAMAESFLIGGHTLHITASIGIALYSGDAESAEEVLRHASTAVNRCKERERNRCMFYLPDMQAAAEQRLTIEKDLRNALDTNAFQLFFQPQVEASGKIVGAEALLRWHHPQRGDIPPMEFIPIAEETGLILLLGEWVLHEACRRITLWKQEGINKDLRHIAVNISPRQFRQPDFTAVVKRVLAATGAEPSMLVFEITEGMAINNLDDTIAKMQELKKLGIRFSIDDFGTGYSCLSYLHSLPLDQLKIDRSFTQGLAKGSRFASIVSAIIILADNLGLTVIAEGVETVTELAYLRENNCSTFQGYFFSRPLPPADFQDRLRTGIPTRGNQEGTFSLTDDT